MKVYIGPFVNWVGPYQIAEKLCFWAKKETDEHGFKRTPGWVHDFGTRLAENKDGSDTRLTKVCNWIHNKKHRKVKIKLDRYDSWNVDATLSMVALPLLKQLRDSQHGSPMVDPEDVPEEMRVTKYEDWSQQLDFFCDDEYKTASWDMMHKQWKWVLDEIIWAFEQVHPDNDWEAQYHSGVHDWDFVPCEDNPNLSQMVSGPNDTHKFDAKGYAAHAERIQRGLKLFGKYYQGLWD